MNRITTIALINLIVSCSSMINQGMFLPADNSRQRVIKEFSLIPQEILLSLDSMGIDNDNLLTEKESQYLNYIFQLQYTEYDLTGKSVIFKGSKKSFFSDEANRYANNDSPVGGCSIYFLNEDQIKESGGNYAIIVYWHKIELSKYQIDRVIKKRGGASQSRHSIGVKTAFIHETCL